MADVVHISIGGALVSFFGFLGKHAWGAIKRDRKLLQDIHTEMTLQRTNCLTSIQGQGDKQIELLGQIDRGIAEQTGYLKGVIDGRS